MLEPLDFDMTHIDLKHLAGEPNQHKGVIFAFYIHTF